jgi:Fe-S-cluster containining protein
MCGDCCRVVTVNRHTVKRVKEGKQELVNAPPDQLLTDEARKAAGERNARWVRSELTEISRAEAYKRLPNLKGKVGRQQGTYICSNFDGDTNMCRAHNDKPSICAGFPWYGKEPHKGALDGLPNCGYRVDLPESDG